ncbi:MAG: hypothetical protein K2H86_07810 [Muribaculaceae bacterium]|nr:hypothetical protein [Muribaculaceae bacterium]
MKCRKTTRVFALGLLSLLCLWGCRHTPADILSQLDIADSLMETDPDSAMSIIGNIDTTRIAGCADHARYALLKSIALDKNYIDTTSLSILQPALDYYLRHGDADQRLKTRYYEGRIYMNRGDDDAALTAFLHASEDTSETLDRRAVARLLIAQGHMYYQELNYKQYLNCNLQAADIYRSHNDSVNYYACLSRALVGANLTNDTTLLNPLLEECITGLIPFGNDIDNLPVSVISAFSAHKSQKDFDTLINNIGDKIDVTPELATELARAYCTYGDMRNAAECINKGDATDSLHYFAIRSEIMEKCGDDKGALDAYRKYLTAEENSLEELINNNLLFTRRKYNLDLKTVKAEASKKRVIDLSIGIVTLLVLSGIILIIYLRYIKIRLRNTTISLKNSELIRENNELSLKIANTEYEKMQAEHALLKERLDAEKSNLEELLKENEDLSSRLKNLISTRLKLINSLLAKEISGNDKYARPFNEIVSQIHSDKSSFLLHIRETVEISHPRFIHYLKEQGLTDFEIDYVCLYSIGIKGKDLGIYIGSANHYNYSHEIRKKLGLSNDKNYLHTHIIRLMNTL